jgi:hypothetical protein
MKKKSVYTLMLSLLSFYSSNNLSAQIQKGLFSFEGNIEANYADYRETRFRRNFSTESNYYAFLPSISHSFLKHLIVGGTLGVTQEYMSYNWIERASEFHFMIEPHVRYIINPKSKLNLYVDVGFLYERISNTEPNRSDKIQTALGTVYSVGFNRFISKEIAFQGEYIFGSKKITDENNTGNLRWRVLNLSIKSFINFKSHKVAKS